MVFVHVWLTRGLTSLRSRSCTGVHATALSGRLLGDSLLNVSEIYIYKHTHTPAAAAQPCVCVSDVLWVCHFAVIPPCLCTKTRSKPLVRKRKSSGGFWELLRWQIMWLSVNWTEMGLIYIPPPSQTGSVFVWHYFCLLTFFLLLYFFDM